MSMYGIDVSSAQRGLNIKSTGAQFVIVKATDGTRFFSSTANEQVKQAQDAGIPFGFYHFANGVHKSNMKAQAQYFVKMCKPWFGKGIPVLDWEDSDERYGGAVLKYGAGQAKVFLDEVYRLTGVRPMIYMSASVTRMNDWSAVAKDYGLWGAGYANGATYQNPMTSKFSWGAWKTPAIHQYSDSKGALDVNIAYMDVNGWAKFAGANNTESKPAESKPTAEATTVSGTTLDLAYRVMKNEFGTGEERKAKLGNRYDEVQEFITHISKASVETLASEVWSGIYGVNPVRKTVLGERYNEVQTIVDNGRKETAQFYTVAKGDTLGKIAAKYGTTVAKIAKLNPSIRNVNLIYPGQKIRIK